ncbi:hypothetical protein HY995_03775 [Candidatus Micrarchaeota archaeon]|nr:hypothetical protein [Candidatus Micrarchaeota archaeon]MBI5177179.1 hypothetical protein [Candidatus Micrarchaeota archaeon]
MTNVTLAVPIGMKKEMDEFPVINWSEVARQAFAETIKELKLLKKITAKSRLTEGQAFELGRKINASIARKHGA